MFHIYDYTNISYFRNCPTLFTCVMILFMTYLKNKYILYPRKISTIGSFQNIFLL